MPLSVSAPTSAASSAGELRRPSRPTATLRPPRSARMLAKARPMARASASPSVLPTTPRISYSRRIVGSKRWPSGMSAPSAVLVDEPAQLGRQFGARHGIGQIRLQPAELVAAIEAAAGEAQAEERPLAVDQLDEPVGQLDLAAGAAADPLEMAEDLGMQDVAADDAERRGRGLRLRLLDEAADGGEPAVIGG